MRKQKNVRVIMARVTGIDVAARRVHTSEIDLPYDYLVLATGATHSYFGHDDWEPFAPGLKHIARCDRDQAAVPARLRTRRGGRGRDRAGAPPDIRHFGGGATGVEMAGAIAEVARRTLQHDFRRIDPRNSRIVLIEAGPRLLPAFPPSLSDYAARSLRHMGVEVELGRKVIGWMPAEFGGQRQYRGGNGDLGGGRCRLAGGDVDRRRARSRRAHQGERRSRAFPAARRSSLSATPRPVTDREGRPVPGIAPAAKQMGGYVGEVIAARVQGRPPPPPFAYHHLGDLATIGRKSAVVKLGPVQLTGFIGWLFWSAVHIYFLIGLRNRFVVALNWLWSYITYQRGARLIGIEPRSTSA